MHMQSHTPTSGSVSARQRSHSNSADASRDTKPRPASSSADSETGDAVPSSDSGEHKQGGDRTDRQDTHASASAESSTEPGGDVTPRLLDPSSQASPRDYLGQSGGEELSAFRPFSVSHAGLMHSPLRSARSSVSGVDDRRGWFGGGSSSGSPSTRRSGLRSMRRLPPTPRATIRRVTPLASSFDSSSGAGEAAGPDEADSSAKWKHTQARFVMGDAESKRARRLAESEAKAMAHVRGLDNPSHQLEVEPRPQTGHAASKSKRPASAAAQRAGSRPQTIRNRRSRHSSAGRFDETDGRIVKPASRFQSGSEAGQQPKRDALMIKQEAELNKLRGILRRSNDLLQTKFKVYDWEKEVSGAHADDGVVPSYQHTQS